LVKENGRRRLGSEVNGSYEIVILQGFDEYLAWMLFAISVLICLAVIGFAFKSGRDRRPQRNSSDTWTATSAAVVRESAKNGQAADMLVQWSPEMLKQILSSELPDSEVIVVSNREPYIHELRNGAVELHIPASGLVSALEPITRTCGGTWIAHGSGSADRQTVDRTTMSWCRLMSRPIRYDAYG
jgi:hypothetical protein